MLCRGKENRTMAGVINWKSMFTVSMFTLIYVYWLAHGLSYWVVSNVPKATKHMGKPEESHLLPTSREAAGSGGFVQLSRTPAFNNVVGAIDGTHIRIIKPPRRHQIDYLNYKDFYSINMQAICDSSGQFLDVYTCTFYRAQRYPPTGYIILGNGGYPCLDTPLCLITPYKEPVIGQVQGRFNYYQSRARSITERAFGIMKTRWRSTLFRALEVIPTFAPHIASCAFLHNVCLDNGDMLEPEDDISRDNFDFQPPSESMAYNETSGNATDVAFKNARLREKNAAITSEILRDRAEGGLDVGRRK